VKAAVSCSHGVARFYTAGVTAARDYEDMHHLVDRLSPRQVRRLRLLVTQDEELAQVAGAVSLEQPSEDEPVPEGLIALIGSIQGPADLAERHDDYLRERMERRFGNTE